MKKKINSGKYIFGLSQILKEEKKNRAIEKMLESESVGRIKSIHSSLYQEWAKQYKKI
jgi:hypothetical protein